jgi:hypothetical protein
MLQWGCRVSRLLEFAPIGRAEADLRPARPLGVDRHSRVSDASISAIDTRAPHTKLSDAP